MAMISVAMATFNGEKFIKEQLESVLAQSYSDFELIVVDDNSTDGTLTILRDFEARDNRVFVFHNKDNLGFKENFEKSIGFCKSQYIALCDQDDIWTFDHLELLINNIGHNSLICSDAELIDSKGKSLNLCMAEVLGIQNIPSSNLKIFKHLLYQNFVQGSTMLFEKSILKSALPIPRSIKFHDHWLAQIASCSNGIKYLDSRLVKYRQHESNVTENKRWEWKKPIKKYQENKHLNCLELLDRMQNNLNDQYKIEIKKAIGYYADLKKTKLHFYSAYIFIKNYEDIYWEKSSKLMVPRVAKILFGVI